MGHRLAQNFLMKCVFTKECPPPISVLAGIPAFLHGIQYNPCLRSMSSKHPVAGKMLLSLFSIEKRYSELYLIVHISAYMRKKIYLPQTDILLFMFINYTGSCLIKDDASFSIFFILDLYF